MGASGTEFDSEYGADQIQILEGLEAVRKRPGMRLISIKTIPLPSAITDVESRLGSIIKQDSRQSK